MTIFAALLFAAALWLMFVIWNAPTLDDQAPTHPPVNPEPSPGPGEPPRRFKGASLLSHWRGFVFAVLVVLVGVPVFVLMGVGR